MKIKVHYIPNPIKIDVSVNYCNFCSFPYCLCQYSFKQLVMGDLYEL